MSKAKSSSPALAVLGLGFLIIIIGSISERLNANQAIAWLGLTVWVIGSILFLFDKHIVTKKNKTMPQSQVFVALGLVMVVIAFLLARDNIDSAAFYGIGMLVSVIGFFEELIARHTGKTKMPAKSTRSKK